MVPMRKSKECTKEHQLSAYGQQNTSIKNTHSKSIQLNPEQQCFIIFFVKIFKNWKIKKTEVSTYQSVQQGIE